MEGWNKMIFKVSSNPKPFYDSTIQRLFSLNIIDAYFQAISMQVFHSFSSWTLCILTLAALQLCCFSCSCWGFPASAPYQGRGQRDPQGQAGSWPPALNLAPLTAQPGSRGAKHHDQASVTIGRNLMVTQTGWKFRENTWLCSWYFWVLSLFVCQNTHSQIM